MRGTPALLAPALALLVSLGSHAAPGADATITNCDIRGHHFPFANHTSCGMLSYLGGTINIADSIFAQNQTSVYFLDSGGFDQFLQGDQGGVSTRIVVYHA